jgi:hypothetical protein
VNEERDLVVGASGTRIANDQPAEQTAIDVASDAANVIVKHPGADRLVRRFEDIGPALPGQDFVAAPSVMGPNAEWPCAIGIDPVVQPMQVKAVTIAGVGIADMYM